MADSVWEAIKVFEGNLATVSTDFDCQGMSIGVAQWNIGKSFEAVRAIVLSVPVRKLSQLMPVYGDSFVKALSKGQEETLAYVRALQIIQEPSSCDAKTRKARWSKEGLVFVKELAQVLATPEAVSKQRQLRFDVFKNGLKNASLWAHAVRGSTATPTLREVAYFVDMQNFNGGGLSKFGLDYRTLESTTSKECVSHALTYLKTADENYLLHKQAARRNSDLLKIDSLNNSERDLFCLSYQVALKLNADYARQFRLTTINRRAVILFGQAYYADRDTKPVQVSFPSSP